MGLCWQNVRCIKGYFNDNVLQISLYVIEEFIVSSIVKYILWWFLFDGNTFSCFVFFI